MKNLSKILLLLFAICTTHSVSTAQMSAQQTWAGTAGGSANAITLSVPNVNSLSDLVGVPIRFNVSITNTGATTVTVNSTTATAVKKITSTGLAALVGNELIAANPAEIFYDGTEYVISTPYPQIVASSNTVQGFGTAASSGAFTYTPSVGILRDYVQCWGGGGGGQSVGSGSHVAGNGGGGGEYRFGVFAITPGAAITVTTGAGGAPGVAGGNTSFGSYLTAMGGNYATGAVGTGGSGGTGGIGIDGYSGNAGFTDAANDNFSGNGGAAFGTSLAIGNSNGNFPGSGGGGGNGGSGPGTGGTGAKGFCIVQELVN